MRAPTNQSFTSPPRSGPRGPEKAARPFTDRRELAHRTGDGIEVILLWSKPSNRVTIAVHDTRSDETLEFEVDGSAALDAFSHPYAYAATRHTHNLAISRVKADDPTVGTNR
jgi:hypothetical protein